MKASTAAILKRLQAKRKAGNAALPVILDPNFGPQNRFIEDPSRYLAAQCSRRSGKTNGLAIRFIRTMAKHPGSQCIYLALTQDSARDILWPVLQEFNDRFNLGYEFIESKLTVVAPNGAKLRLMGADLSNFIKRLKGRKYPGVAIDEAQDFGMHLQSLVDDVLTPSIADYADGWLALTGTPGPVPRGYFFDITQGHKFGYSLHTWTLLDNPYMPNPRQFIEDLKAKREWKDDHPTLMREWMNHWVLDTDSLWIRYNDALNHYTQLPDVRPSQYHYILGIDIGWKDADALAVLAWHESTPCTYLVEEIVTPKQGITELVEQIQTLQTRYKFDKMVMDEGGLGKKIGEELRRQKSMPIEAADKALKHQNVEFLNDALRLGKFKAKSASKFAQDSYVVQIDWEKSTPDRIVVKKHPHSDIIDAVLYAFKFSPAWSYREPSKKLQYGTKEWAEAQPKQMFEEAKKFFEAEAERTRRWNGGDY